VAHSVSLVFTVRGPIHLMGFVVYWRLATLERISYPSALLGGYLPAPTSVVRVLAPWRRERCWRTGEGAHDAMITSLHRQHPPLR